MDCIMETINTQKSPSEKTISDSSQPKEITFKKIMLQTISHWGIEYGDSLSHYARPPHESGQ